MLIMVGGVFTCEYCLGTVHKRAHRSHVHTFSLPYKYTEAKKVTLWNAHMDEDLFDDDILTIRRAQQTAWDAWVVEEVARR